MLEKLKEELFIMFDDSLMDVLQDEKSVCLPFNDYNELMTLLNIIGYGNHKGLIKNKNSIYNKMLNGISGKKDTGWHIYTTIDDLEQSEVERPSAFHDVHTLIFPISDIPKVLDKINQFHDSDCFSELEFDGDGYLVNATS